MKAQLDIGPWWVALHCGDERHHAWAKSQFARHTGPFLTCEAVVTETRFLLLRTAMTLPDELAAVCTMFGRPE